MNWWMITILIGLAGGAVAYFAPYPWWLAALPLGFTTGWRLAGRRF